MSQISCKEAAHWARVKAIFDSAAGDYAKAEPLLMKEFGWTAQQCYQATEHLCRPRSGN